MCPNRDGHVVLVAEQGTGKSVMMLVHYTRDTAEKQWNETRVYALQGSARVFRQFLKVQHCLPHISSLNVLVSWACVLCRACLRLYRHCLLLLDPHGGRI